MFRPIMGHFQVKHTYEKSAKVEAVQILFVKIFIRIAL
jgi:hypothetical protein